MGHEGPIVIAYDRSSPARSALHATGELASGRDALVIVVPVAGTIVAVAADSDAPAIVIGAHRRDDEVQLGTTGREVLRRAGRPVLTVPPRYAAAGSP